MTMGLAIQLASIVLLATLSKAQQGYGLSYPPQFFYLAPSDAAVVLAQHAGTLVPEPTRKTLPVDAEEGETAQFHSQDGKGRAVFGYLSPDQSRVEERSRDGSVRGAYSYLDPDGRAVKVQYWDNGAGFHSAGNNLPSVLLGLPQPIQDTPEVQLAKEQHLHFYQQTLLHHQQQLEAAGHKEDEFSSNESAHQPKPDIPQSGEAGANNASVQQFLLEQKKHQEQQLKQLEALGTLYDNALTQQSLVQSPQHNTGTLSDSVVVESDNSNVQEDDGTELIRYPNLDKFPQNLYDPTQIHDANRDAVIVESSDSVGGETNSLRTGKSTNIDLVDSDKEASSNVAQSVENSKEEDKTAERTFEKMEDKNILAKGENKIEPVKNQGFFYSFQHPIPIYVQVKTITEDEDKGKSGNVPAESLSHSQQAAYFGAIPVAAVHDFQVPPWQRESFKNAGLPLYTAPIPERNPETNRPFTYSQKAHYFGAIPVAAVHDQQVHPKQQGSFPDHQTSPLYIETSVEDNK
ncbi:uncharacterized protein [Anabrus simplex]|uniref:uncharacterized protein isoform X2 n=1 Tax=Anabrus simplex TaxID=316456 RepID=UPI0035A2BB56